MPFKRIIGLFSMFTLIGLFAFWFLNQQSQKVIEDVQVQSEVLFEKQIINEVTSEKLSKEPTETLTQFSKVIPVEKILGKSLSKVKKYESIKIQDSTYEITLDYSACVVNECDLDVEIIPHSKFSSIQKIAPSSFIDESSPFLAVIDSNNRNMLGVWNKNILIQVKKETQLETSLKDLGFQNIQSPLATLYIATYYGELSRVNDTIKIIKALSGVEEVQMEVSFQQRKN